MSPSITLSVLSKHQRTEGLGMECTVPVEVRLATEHADVGSLERTIGAALAEVAIHLWRELVARLEATLPVPVSCDACQGRLKANGRAPRRLVTLAGEVELRRRRYRCTGCGAEAVPLDEALGLEPRIQHTLGVRERGLWLVTEMSYAKAVETAEALRRWPIGRGELHRWVAAEGGRLERGLVAETEALLGAHPDRRRRTVGPRRGTVWVSADGTMVHDRASGTEFEVKVGLVFEGARRTGRTRRALTGRTLHAGTEGWTAWAERFTALCTRLGVYEAERILFVSDGAASIRWIRERSFPTAVELLDWYHLVEALRRALGPDDRARLAQALALAEPGDAAGLLALLERWAAAELDPDRAAKLWGVAGYVAANRRGIENYAIVPMASSGPMEKAVDIVVARRFKARGMSWFRRGVSALVRLRTLRLNGTWNRYWSERFRAALLPWPSPA